MDMTKQLRRFRDFRRVTAGGRVYILRKRSPHAIQAGTHNAPGTKEKEVPR